MAVTGGTDIPLSTLYLQIEYANSPFAVLGINSQPKELELRESYHRIALRMHPDRAPNDYHRELHTSLFQNIQAAYHALLKDHLDKSGDDQFGGPKRLPETLESLHARNVAFREALRNERESALKAKHAADAREAAKQAKLKVKNERLAKQREAQTQVLQESHERKEVEIERRSTQTAKRRQQTAIKNADLAAVSDSTRREAPLDWEQELERLEAEEQQLEAEKERLEADPEYQQTKVANKTGPAIPKRSAQSKPTARTARPMWDNGLDQRLASDAEITGRWEKQLLSGGRSGSISPSEKKQKEHGGAARVHKYTKALCEEANGMVKPALTGNRTFSALVVEEMMDSAFIGAEAKIEKRTDTVLRLMDQDVREQYLLEDEGQERVMALEYFVSDGKRSQ